MRILRLVPLQEEGCLYSRDGMLICQGVNLVNKKSCSLTPSVQSLSLFPVADTHTHTHTPWRTHAHTLCLTVTREYYGLTERKREITPSTLLHYRQKERDYLPFRTDRILVRYSCTAQESITRTHAQELETRTFQAIPTRPKQNVVDFFVCWLLCLRQPSLRLQRVGAGVKSAH